MLDENEPDTPKDNESAENKVPPVPPESVSPTPVSPTDATDAALNPDGTTPDIIKPQVKRKTLSIIIHDAGVLRAAYMQFVKGGGLFIPTKKPFNMGEDTNLVIRLLDDDEPYRVSGKVVWITPFGTANNKAGGIGVEFMEDKNGEKLRNRIEIILGPHLKSTESTHTM